MTPRGSRTGPCGVSSKPLSGWKYRRVAYLLQLLYGLSPEVHSLANAHFTMRPLMRMAVTTQAARPTPDSAVWPRRKRTTRSVTSPATVHCNFLTQPNRKDPS